MESEGSSGKEEGDGELKQASRRVRSFLTRMRVPVSKKVKYGAQFGRGYALCPSHSSQFDTSLNAYSMC